MSDHQSAREAFERALGEPDSGPTFLHRFMGLRIALADDACSVEFDHADHFANRQRKLHGGVIALLFDMTMGALHRNTIGPGITLEMKVQYIRPIEDGTVRCESRFLKQGRRISFMEARLWAPGDTLAASASATWIRAE